MQIEQSKLYKQLQRRTAGFSTGAVDLLSKITEVRNQLKQSEKFIALTFPEYTPHDDLDHLSNLFYAADRVLGEDLYKRFADVEIVIFAIALYAHDWGMAVPISERNALISGRSAINFPMLPDEPKRASSFMSSYAQPGPSQDERWQEYVRVTHGFRSGCRLRNMLEPAGKILADAIARVAEGHTLGQREIRDPSQYPQELAVAGGLANLAALANYVRIIDLLDIGDDRTPYALWKFVSPVDEKSRIEWKKHRSLSPVSVSSGSPRVLKIAGYTNQHEIYAALADLRAWVDDEFRSALEHLRELPPRYNPGLDSRIEWEIRTTGFEPHLARFECDRAAVLKVLSKELYQHDRLAFVRELLQNSVDAIDAHRALLKRHTQSLDGQIRIDIASRPDGLYFSCADNGIGMDLNALSSYFASVGRSWYRSREARDIASIDAISQFGIGVLSCFATAVGMTVETRRSPLVSGSSLGIVATIPSIESFFRVQTSSEIPIGTRISFTIAPNKKISKESIARAIEKTALFVAHSVVLTVDGLMTRVARQSAPNSPEMLTSYDRSYRIEDPPSGLSQVSTISFEFNDPMGEFHGQYSAAIPRDPKTVESVSHGVWKLDGKKIELANVVWNREQTLYVKGIRVGPVWGASARGPHWDFREKPFQTEVTSWLAPKISIDLLKPSLLSFNLERSSVRAIDSGWIGRAWTEIGAKLKDSLPWSTTESASDCAQLLGVCALYGAFPPRALEVLLPSPRQTPLLVLRKGGVLEWVNLGQFVESGEFVEAPFELAYANWHILPAVGEGPSFPAWMGPDGLFPGGQADYYNYPTFPMLEKFGRRMLKRLGWRPVELQTLSSPASDNMPLCCRVFRKLDQEQSGGCEDNSLVQENARLPYNPSPELLRFPKALSEFAAIGSRYWNIEHPKVKAIRSVLAELDRHRRELRLSSDRERLVNYLCSTDYIGHLVASRHSGNRLARELPNRLLRIAEGAGIGNAASLAESDFFPGSIIGYKNPYYYDLEPWRSESTPLGLPLGAERQI